MVSLALPERTDGWLQFMPAGPAPRREYWLALKQLRERIRFDDPSGKGLSALLDLHARIQDELRPDYLLIDARTGVTELSGLATTALAEPSSAPPGPVRATLRLPCSIGSGGRQSSVAGP